MIINTKIEDLTLKFAEKNEVDEIFYFIKELAKYEKMENEVVATREILIENIFNKKYCEVILAKYKNEYIGFMLFFYNFSTFLGKPGIYLEDLYIEPKYRGKGYGKEMLTNLFKIANNRGCGRVEWSCLDWNKPSLEFYKKIGAKSMDEWITLRIDGETLKKYK
ncbi:acetyltransferase (GNAT) family protein [Hypnocyclicus thermotrophus]|uniref:Acetyltransferase (GNAT) family protein n=1 Tax=Hypnocyclicus thermotrophus TaxID=1627895 RepID=A0AA46E1R3_9FUSO|nr:GNAT family N-acetyltransferase [Hypnocyclicus thermotrophus]TDT72573.1 acetyltransferase (GNAT) family protein [Hypnocyclicus thermotrophus]